MTKDVSQVQPEGTQKEKEGSTNNEDNWTIPLPAIDTSKRRIRPISSSSTPLLPIRQRNPKPNPSLPKRGANLSSSSLLFGSQQYNVEPSSPERFRLPNTSADDRDTKTVNDGRPKGFAGFFFGFMYEEPFKDSIDYDDEEDSAAPSVWNSLNLALFVAYSLTTAATTVPILLIPTMAKEFLADTAEASAFTSRAASSAVLGTACGKFLNGPVGDVLGARRTSVLYSFLLSLSLLGLAFCGDTPSAAWACFYVEFFQSVQWPCILITLATHYYGPHSHTMYEGGIYVTSIASRFGSLVGIPFFSILLRRTHWRFVCLIGAWVAMIGASVAYLFVADSPHRINEPQNALNPDLLHQIATADFRAKPKRCVRIAVHVVHSVIVNNVMPSLRHVLKSGTFWIVALAHTGSSMVRTSERILSTYFHDTSMGYLSESKAGGLSVFMAFGTIVGLMIAGNMFTQRKERQRKWLVSRLYMITIGACYCLAILAIPSLRYMIDAPGLVLFFQILASFVMGFGISVMFYHIPGLVGSAFGNHKGLFSAYTDGVAYGISSIVWKIVASAVENGSPEGGGWFYGWSAVALMIILCGLLMVEFMEHYFVRASGRHHGTYETIIFA
jgi:MFS family permease